LEIGVKAYFGEDKWERICWYGGGKCKKGVQSHSFQEKCEAHGCDWDDRGRLVAYDLKDDVDVERIGKQHPSPRGWKIFNLTKLRYMSLSNLEKKSEETGPKLEEGSKLTVTLMDGKLHFKTQAKTMTPIELDDRVTHIQLYIKLAGAKLELYPHKP